MTCEETQKLNMDFIKGNLELKKMSDYIRHIEECKNCREELDIMHIVAVGLDDVDNSSNESFNFPSMLARKIEEAKLVLRMNKKKNRVMISVSAISYTLLSIAVILYFYFG